MGKKLRIIIAVAIFLRLALSAVTFHSDLQPFYLAGSVIAKGYTTTFYDYLNKLPPDSPTRLVYPTYLFNYPPLVYFTLGPLHYLLGLPFGRAFMQNFTLHPSFILGDLKFSLVLLVLKLPYLFFDLMVGVYLYKFFET